MDLRTNSRPGGVAYRCATWILLCFVWLGLGSQVQAQEFAWVEGEAAAANIKPNISGWGHKEFLSDEKWLADLH